MADKQSIAPEEIDDYVMNLMFKEDGPMMELLQPFLSPAIYYERIQDVNSGNFLTAGRGGRTAEGNYIYSPIYPGIYEHFSLIYKNQISCVIIFYD